MFSAAITATRVEPFSIRVPARVNIINTTISNNLTGGGPVNNQRWREESIANPARLMSSTAPSTITQPAARRRRRHFYRRRLGNDKEQHASGNVRYRLWRRRLHVILEASTSINVTVTNNRTTANDGGGLAQSSTGTARLENTIIAGNFKGASPGTTASDISGEVSGGYNLIGTGGSGGLFNGLTDNQVGVADARLGPLANNGGPTQTHALLSDSPALDVGGITVANAGLTTDQRGIGFARIVDGPDVNSTATIDRGSRWKCRVALANIADQIINGGQINWCCRFDLGDQATVASVTASSSDTGLVPNDSAHISGFSERLHGHFDRQPGDQPQRHNEYHRHCESHGGRS